MALHIRIVLEHNMVPSIRQLRKLTDGLFVWLLRRHDNDIVSSAALFTSVMPLIYNKLSVLGARKS